MNEPQHVILLDVLHTANQVAGRGNLVEEDPMWNEYEKQLSELVVVWFNGLSPLVLTLDLWQAVSQSGGVIPMESIMRKGDW